MNDQATELRKLAINSRDNLRPDDGPGPRLLVLASGKRGVGVTTLAVHLSAVAAAAGQRVVLVDADPESADASRLCGLAPRGEVADVMAARSEVREVLRMGPPGVQILPGVANESQREAPQEAAQRRLATQLKQLGSEAEMVLVDAGAGGAGRWRPEEVDHFVFVTTPDPVSVMDCYASIKAIIEGGPHDRVSLIVNRCELESVALDVARRVDQSCRRFLNISVSYLGALLQCDALSKEVASDSFTEAGRSATATAALREIVERLIQPKEASERSVA